MERKIHYCWFGHNEKPELAIACIKSWEKYFPDYEIIEWNESNFDVNIIPYTKEAYERKKYAFVSDYARFWILYNYGGIYFDTDVEVLQSFDPILKLGGFMGCENDENIAVNPGLGMGVSSHNEIIKHIMTYYEEINFIKSNGQIDTDTVVTKTTNILLQYGLKNKNGIQNFNGFNVYPKIYFCPDEKARKTGNYDIKTFSAHHYSASWRDEKFNKRLKNPVWIFIFKILAFFGNIVKKIIGKKKWESIRDIYLIKLYNFVRGTKD